MISGGRRLGYPQSPSTVASRSAASPLVSPARVARPSLRSSAVCFSVAGRCREGGVLLVLVCRPLQEFQDGLPGQPARVTAKQGGGGVQRVLRTHPDDVQDETISLTGIGPGAPAEHLLIEHRTLRGPCDDDAV